MSNIVPYIKCSFLVEPKEPWSDLLVADLGQQGFEAFEETEAGFDAYIQQPEFNESTLKQAISAYADSCKVTYSIEEIAAVNWNEKWESEFEPVLVDDRCAIVAPFHHLDQSYEHTITLTPKMAFGTGHHQTTFLMVRHLLDLDLAGKSVLDMGCGTGVLAILAAMKGAKTVLAMDNDEWAYENCLENVNINQAEQVIVEKGDASMLEGHSFNIILANINKNVLLEDIGQYASCLLPGGHLMLSGFFEEDINDIDSECVKHSFKKNGSDVLRNWTMLHYVKQ